MTAAGPSVWFSQGVALGCDVSAPSGRGLSERPGPYQDRADLPRRRSMDRTRALSARWRQPARTKGPLLMPGTTLEPRSWLVFLLATAAPLAGGCAAEAQSTGSSRPIRLDVTHDTWVSEVGREADGNNGASPRLKFKSIQ